MPVAAGLVILDSPMELLKTIKLLPVRREGMGDAGGELGIEG